MPKAACRWTWAPISCFDTLANTDDARTTLAQLASRVLLRDAMRRQGFSNYPIEWWHYTLKPEPSPSAVFDFPVRRQQARQHPCPERQE